MRHYIRRAPQLVVPLAAAVTLVVAAGAGAAPGAARDDGSGNGNPFQGDNIKIKDVDARKGNKDPSAGQQSAAREGDVSVRWNKLGTPEVVAKPAGYIATGLPSDPVAAARQWVTSNRQLLGLSEDAAAGLELVASNPIGQGSAVLLRQRFGGLAAGLDGLLVVGVVDGKVAFASTSLSKDTGLSGSTSISAEDALRAAAADVSVALGDLSPAGQENGWILFNASALQDVQRARLVAVPTPENGVRPAWEVLVSAAADDVSVQSFIDAGTGALLDRENLIDYATDDPQWKAFRAYPSLDYSSTDTRELWCWTPAPDCALVLQNPSSPLAWDVDPATGLPTNTTSGNNDQATENWLFNQRGHQGTELRDALAHARLHVPVDEPVVQPAVQPGTTFTSPQRNDIDAARREPVRDAQPHARLRVPARLHRDDLEPAGQTTSASGGARQRPRAGQRPGRRHRRRPAGVRSRATTRTRSRRRTACRRPATCTSGSRSPALLLAVRRRRLRHVGHRARVHARDLQPHGRGPERRLSGFQAGSMGESWSDLDAIEYLYEYGYVPVAGENPFAVGAYVTGDPRPGHPQLRASTRSPLNYSDVGYDTRRTGGARRRRDLERHQLRPSGRRLSDRYGAGNAALQLSCADGLTAVASCPGNRRWIQLVFDAWLLMASGQVSMVDARDALLAADQIRFGGANQDLIWNAFASRGFGENASSNGGGDTDPVPSFESPSRRTRR